jgi:hypothetical protein
MSIFNTKQGTFIDVNTKNADIDNKLNVPTLTQAQVDNGSPQNGDIIYNIDLDLFQIYHNNMWQSIQSGGGGGVNNITNIGATGEPIFKQISSNIAELRRINGIGNLSASTVSDVITFDTVASPVFTDVSCNGELKSDSIDTVNNTDLLISRNNITKFTIGETANTSEVNLNVDLLDERSLNNGIRLDKKLRIKSYTTTERNALVDVANGDMIYNSTDNQFNFYENGSWVNAGGNPFNQSLNTTDNVTFNQANINNIEIKDNNIDSVGNDLVINAPTGQQISLQQNGSEKMNITNGSVNIEATPFNINNHGCITNFITLSDLDIAGFPVTGPTTSSPTNAFFAKLNNTITADVGYQKRDVLYQTPTDQNADSQNSDIHFLTTNGATGSPFRVLSLRGFTSGNKLDCFAPIHVDTIDEQTTNNGIRFDKRIRVKSYTTTQRNSLIGVGNGDIIYNTTENHFQFYENGTWTNNDAGNPFDQTLNTTDNVEFNRVSISQIAEQIGDTGIEFLNKFQAKGYSNVERLALGNVNNGDIIYNTDTNNFNFYSNGWFDVLNNQTLNTTDDVQFASVSVDQISINGNEINTTAGNNLLIDTNDIADNVQFRQNNNLIAEVDNNGIDLAAGKVYLINGANTLSAATLGSNVVNSSLTNLGTLTELQVDNININLNTITTTDTNGSLNLFADGTGDININNNLMFTEDNKQIEFNSVLRTINGNVSSGIRFDVPTAEFYDFYINANLEARLNTNGLNIASGRDYFIDGNSVLSSDTLGNNIVNSSLTNVGTLTNLTVDEIDLNDNKISTNTTNVDLVLEADGTGDVKANLINNTQYLRILKNTDTTDESLINLILKSQINAGAGVGAMNDDFGSQITFDVENADDNVDITQARILTKRNGADNSSDFIIQASAVGSLNDIFRYDVSQDEYVIRNPPNTGGTSLTIDTGTGRIQRALISSKRFKKNIVKSKIDSSILHKINIVDFNYKNDENEYLHTGIIAEELDKYPQFRQYLNYDKDGLVESIQYRNLCIPLLKEVQMMRNEIDLIKKHINI